MELRQWNSSISISTNYDRHLKWWDEDFYKDGSQVQSLNSYCYLSSGYKFKTCLLYARGAAKHQDTHLDTPYSALLIIYSKGFLVWQEGLGTIPQKPGTIVLLDLYKTHELAKIDGRCSKWAAISIDYYDPLPPKIIEAQLEKTYDRIFN